MSYADIRTAQWIDNTDFYSLKPPVSLLLHDSLDNNEQFLPNVSLCPTMFFASPSMLSHVSETKASDDGKTIISLLPDNGDLLLIDANNSSNKEDATAGTLGDAVVIQELAPPSNELQDEEAMSWHILNETREPEAVQEHTTDTAVSEKTYSAGEMTAETTSQSKKRKGNRQTWKCNISKAKRMRGVAYESKQYCKAMHKRNNVARNAHQLGPRCKGKKCDQQANSQQRKCQEITEAAQIFRLRTGHNRLNHHLHTKFGIGQTGEHPCNMGQQTADHILQTCPTYAAARDNVWPPPTSLEKKLYGSLGDLRVTAAFIQETGLDI